MPRVFFRHDYYISGGIGICQLRCYLVQIRQFELDGLAIESDLKKKRVKTNEVESKSINNNAFGKIYNSLL